MRKSQTSLSRFLRFPSELNVVCGETLPRFWATVIVFATMSMIKSITASLRTDTGQVREHNEDFVGLWEPVDEDERAAHGWLYIVADGVGGADAGELASQHATEQTIRFFIDSYIDGEAEEPAERLENAIRNANSTLRKLSDDRGTARAMATTMVAVAIYNGSAVIANVGDSRGYLIRGNDIRQITKDQSLVAELVEAGTITEEEAAVHPQRNVILSSLGPMRVPRIELFDVDIEDGDIMLLCSDGLTRHVSDEEIATVARSQDTADATQQLIDMANERGGSDNISVALLHLEIEITDDVVVAGSGTQTAVQSDNGVVSAGQSAGSRWKMWTYTAFLSMVEASLITMAYYWLRG